MILRIILRNVSRLGMIFVLLLSSFTFNFDQALSAGGSINVIPGNNGLGTETNMVIEWTIGADLDCGDSWTFEFANGMFEEPVNSSDISVTDLDDLAANTAYVVSAATTIKEITIIKGGLPGCTTTPAGHTLAFYIGPADNEVEGYVTGEPAASFNASADTLFVNHVSILTENVTTDSIDANFWGDTGSYTLEESFMEVTVGNHEIGNETNMRIDFPLTYDLNCDPDGAAGSQERLLKISFAHDLIDDVGGIPLFSDIDITVRALGYTDPHLTFDSVTTNSITFSRDDVASGCVTFPTGTILRIYLGQDDEYYDDNNPATITDNFVVGTPWFNDSALHNLINSGDPTNELVMIQNIYYNGLFSIYENADRAYYDLVEFDSVDGQSGQKVYMTGNVDPALTMVLSTNAIDFGEMSSEEVLTDNSLLVTVGTNASSGFTLRYTCTPFENTREPYEINPLVVEYAQIGVEGWGVNLIANSGANGDAGAFGQNSAGVNINVDYTQDDLFKINTDGISGDYELIDYGVYTGAYSFASVLSSSTVTPAGNYLATLTFNVYATF